ncbi:ABC transporter ATP-binding protein [Marinobacter salinisoli]|uniref:ABC transporter ATP-binding protein n=1 Tax=Marinobacter salinisoli TaxID=2769486 RepID=A0ABX7MV72_9GAMM|nr:ABC transporter ATP-binding protein [Marinobacter salinisoli]QSP95360.1 ABC transporter ATP-binding protein [Marinobacter salinisoli]
MSAAQRLRLANIVKEYPGCRANDGIDLVVEAGEIHALLGENGAGKSTLMKVIYGLVQPDEGQVFWNGKPVQVANPAEARAMGIGMVFQHFSLFETLTVAENIALGLPASEARDRAELEARIREVSEHYGMALDPRRYVSTLSVGERQRVEIVRCLIQESTLLILDEPTSVLTPQEVTTLFATLRKLSAEGCSILFISHKLEEVRALCDNATVLRHGRVSGDCRPAEISATQIARLMVGEDTPISTRVSQAQPGELLLEAKGLSWRCDDPFGTSLQGVSFNLHRGEIVGIAGVAGNGQDELLKALSGEVRIDTGRLTFEGQRIEALKPDQRRATGIAIVPEERLGRGAVPGMTLADNALLTAAGQGLVRHGMIRFGRVREFCRQVIERFGVRCNGEHSTAGSLSGGNLQKYIIGREALQNPRLLVASHPTWGVDVGSAVAIHEALIRLRDEGAAILLISEDLDELYQLCNRMGALCGGRLSPLADASDLSIEQLGQWMAGEFESGEASHAAA